MSGFIELENIQFCYPRTGFAIRDISISLQTGEAALLSGRNGSGKSTLAKLMMGILKPKNGVVRIAGQDIRRKDLSEVAQHAGYLFQNPQRQLFCRCVLDEVLFSLLRSGLHDDDARQKAMELLDSFSLAHKADEYPLKLSVGEMKRLALLCVFAMEPKYYILDEPSTGMDTANRQKLYAMLEMLKSSGAGLCIVSHDVALRRRIAERIVTLEDGKVISDECA